MAVTPASPSTASATSPNTAASDELWQAVADPTRRRLLDELLAAGGATPSGLAERMPVTRQAVSKHLVVLERTGLVTSRRSGREVLFAVSPARLGAASELLRAAAEAWDGRLARIKALAEHAEAEQARGADA
ncbi:ArsR/SmtB family transcription factor [Gryllotalpicola reticulitermitis]|uniref:ArsR/SmtB family transcription factor n=1 Tax=Gryllotalpicola reticulitermitis TaxID=1184153 RepID=A0ABV8QBR5_9MICO